MPSSSVKAAIILHPYARAVIYPACVTDALTRLCAVTLDIPTPESLTPYAETLADVELLFTSWGAPQLSEENLALMPMLKGVFYGAGSIRPIVTEAFWKCQIPISAASSINAISVAEYSFAQIILCLKKCHHFAQVAREGKSHFEDIRVAAPLGTFGAVVGLVSLGEIARQVLLRLRTLDVQVQVYDPFLSQKEANALGVTVVDLQTLFRSSDVISLHTPSLPETRGMITESLLSSLKHGAAFINTARGALVDEPAMCRVLAQRPDIQAVIDVTAEEPLSEDSPLRTLSNAYLTPHIAGSVDRECARMGFAMVEEASRFLRNEPLKFRVDAEMCKHRA